MKKKKWLEWTKKYPAIDGNERGGLLFHFDDNKLLIRSDVEKILRLSDEEFENWYRL